jgi:hypothetical protein
MATFMHFHALQVISARGLKTDCRGGGQVRSWHLDTLEGEERVLSGHIQPVRAVAAWGEYLVSASDDTEIKVGHAPTAATATGYRGISVSCCQVSGAAFRSMLQYPKPTAATAAYQSAAIDIEDDVEGRPTSAGVTALNPSSDTERQCKQSASACMLERVPSLHFAFRP